MARLYKLIYVMLLNLLKIKTREIVQYVLKKLKQLIVLQLRVGGRAGGVLPRRRGVPVRADVQASLRRGRRRHAHLT